jgi:hypothetical protein
MPKKKAAVMPLKNLQLAAIERLDEEQFKSRSGTDMTRAIHRDMSERHHLALTDGPRSGLCAETISQH